MNNPELTPVRAAHALDTEALSNFLSAHLTHFENLDAIAQFSGGQSNPTFLITSGATQWVLRKQPPGELLRGAHQVDREYRVMEALADTAVPVPRMHLLCQDAEIIGTDFYVMDFVAGSVVTDPRLPDFEPAARTQLFANLASTLADLHRLDPGALGLSDFGKATGYTARQIHVWSRQYEASKTEENAAMDQLIARLPARVPEEPPTGVVHGDYRLGNLLIREGSVDIAVVLDWELATLGHAWVDLAHCALMYAIPRVSSQFPGIGEKPVNGLPNERQFVATYLEARQVEAPSDWDFYMAMALFRMASICQGVYARSLQGNASDPTAKQYGEVGQVLAQLAAERAGI